LRTPEKEIQKYPAAGMAFSAGVPSVDILLNSLRRCQIRRFRFLRFQPDELLSLVFSPGSSVK
jgi:hypothetical protein